MFSEQIDQLDPLRDEESHVEPDPVRNIAQDWVCCELHLVYETKLPLLVQVPFRS
jgi:hypothetical protein